MTSQLSECGWNNPQASAVLTSQLLEAARAELSALVGEGHCIWNRTLRGFSESWTVFQMSSSQEATTFLTLVWRIQGMKSVTLRVVRVARTTVDGLSDLVEVSLFPVFNPQVIFWADRDESNCPKEWGSFQAFLGYMVEDFSQSLTCQYTSRSAGCWGFP